MQGMKSACLCHLSLPIAISPSPVNSLSLIQVNLTKTKCNQAKPQTPINIHLCFLIQQPFSMGSIGLTIHRALLCHGFVLCLHNLWSRNILNIISDSQKILFQLKIIFCNSFLYFSSKYCHLIQQYLLTTIKQNFNNIISQNRKKRLDEIMLFMFLDHYVMVNADIFHLNNFVKHLSQNHCLPCPFLISLNQSINLQKTSTKFKKGQTFYNHMMLAFQK